MKYINKKEGFTLIELSIVLVILGLIIGTIAPLFVAMSKKNKLSDGQQIVRIARDEVKGEIVRSRVLPTDMSNIGHTIDPWQNSLIYIPAPNMAGQDICTWLAGASNQTGLAVCLNGDCAGAKKSNVAFIVASMSSNFNRQMEAPANHDAIAADREVRLYGYGSQLDQYAVAPDPNNPTDQFDDIVEYVTASELIKLTNCSVSVNNESGQTVCHGGAAIASGVTLGVLQYNQILAVGSTSDNCLSIINSCNITFNAAQSADTDKDGEVGITTEPPGCVLQDL
jgi:prepilin-type N-terminal cleavage/methylation domain-containing protein